MKAFIMHIDFLGPITDEIRADGKLDKLVARIKRDLCQLQVTGEKSPLLISLENALAAPPIPGRQRLADVVRHDIQHGIAQEGDGGCSLLNGVYGPSSTIASDGSKPNRLSQSDEQLPRAQGWGRP